MNENMLIGRKLEQELLKGAVESDRAEFVALYGRRRIGKTFLVKQFFDGKFDFYVTGVFDGSKQEQLLVFNSAINEHSKVSYPIPRNWIEAFQQLKIYLSSLRKKKIIVFIDEMPWFDVPRSKFMHAFEWWWNSWASTKDNLKLIVCGSSTTWVINELIGGKGGLYNRVTRSIYLPPFTMRETAQMLENKQFVLTDRLVCDAYMTLGGVPYYYSLLDSHLTWDQNIDYLFFSDNAPLRMEYDFLFRSLFNDSNSYKRIVEVISRKGKGLTKQEIVDDLNINDNGNLTEILNALCKCDFLRKYNGFGKKERNVMFQLYDLYTLFYLRFVKDNNNNRHFWSEMRDNPSRTSWAGYAFEQVCLHHIEEIKTKIGISGVLSNVCSWFYRSETERAQIDLVIERRDNVIDLCEMKYSDTPYVITKDYNEKMLERRELFRTVTKTKCALHLVMVTLSGIKNNLYFQTIQNEITVSDLIK